MSQERYEMPSTVDAIEDLLDDSLPQANPVPAEEEQPISQTYDYRFESWPSPQPGRQYGG